MPETQTQPEILKPAAPEHAGEFGIEHAPAFPETQPSAPIETPTVIPTAPASVAPLDVMPAQTPVLVQEVEHVLAEGLEDTYQQLDATTQQQFKIVGEATASKVSVLLADVKDQTKKILELIIAWLRIIPGVNQYFLEQEAKIKADKLLRLRHPNS